MSDNKTIPTNTSVTSFLETVSEQRQADSKILIAMMQNISRDEPVMWGPSIIGFGTYHYKYDSGREGDTGLIGFSPRKANLTIYIADGFHEYGDLLDKLGKHRTSVVCLYINKLSDINLDILTQIVERSYETMSQKSNASTEGWRTVDDYLASLDAEQKKRMQTIRRIAHEIIPNAEDVISYQIPTVRYGGKNIVHYAAYKDHVSIYPVPKNIEKALSPYMRGKGTLWFPIAENLPDDIVQKVVQALYVQRGGAKK